MAPRQAKLRSSASRTTATAARAAAHAVENAEVIKDAVEGSGELLRNGMQEGMAAGSRHFAVLGEHAFDAWMRSGNETLQRVVALNAELASWGREQLDDNLTAVRSLSQCRSLGDAYGVQLGLMRSSMENSIRHANRVLGLTAHLMSAGARAGQQSQMND
jgi:hypothetical protein